jgi:hypothetical protein
MKQLIIFVVVAAVLAAGVVFYYSKNSPLNKASAAETAGQYDKAADYYYEALKKASKGMALVDKNRARILPTDKWTDEVKRYMSWITVSYGDPSARSAGAIFLKLRSSCARVEPTHFIAEDSVFAYTEEWMMAEDWDEAFFPQNATIVKNQGPLVRQAMNSNVSVLRIKSLTGYAFEGSLIDVSTWQRTDFTLAPEDEVSLLLRPNAEYVLVCKSHVQFPDGKIWNSPQNIIDLSSPEKSSLRTFILSGQVRRG